jgi:hypothetical protein
LKNLIMELGERLGGLRNQPGGGMSTNTRLAVLTWMVGVMLATASPFSRRSGSYIREPRKRHHARGLRGPLDPPRAVGCSK